MRSKFLEDRKSSQKSSEQKTNEETCMMYSAVTYLLHAGETPVWGGVGQAIFELTMYSNFSAHFRGHRASFLSAGCRKLLRYQGN